MNPASIKLIDEAIKALSNLETVDVDFIANSFIRLAVENKRLYLYGKEGREVWIEVADLRQVFSFDDCVGRFRIILARLCVRAQESNPVSFDGGLYGFTSRACLTYGDNESAELMIETSNTLADNHLIIEIREIGDRQDFQGHLNST